MLGGFDQIVVESLGKLPGLVKPENIRSMHFSRNPKIAEFLKAYKYVKEYGEGVNRMFDEMRAAGLPEPVFYRNNFILQTVVRNKSSYSEIDIENQFEKVAIELQKVPIEEKKVPIRGKKVPVEWLEKFLLNKSISGVMRKSIIELYNVLEENRVFGRSEIAKLLDCSDRNAGKIITAMKSIGILAAVAGKGKGKYIFEIKIEE